MTATRIAVSGLSLCLLLLPACSYLATPPASTPKEPEVLTIHPDGTMKLKNRYIPEDDVVIYRDGSGGERAAIKVRLEPLHPDFYRDTIVVRRLSPEEAEQEGKNKADK